MNTPSIIILVTVAILIIAAWLDYRTANAKMLEKRENCEIRQQLIDVIHSRTNNPSRNPNYMSDIVRVLNNHAALCDGALITSLPADLPQREE